MIKRNSGKKSRSKNLDTNAAAVPNGQIEYKIPDYNNLQAVLSANKVIETAGKNTESMRSKL